MFMLSLLRLNILSCYSFVIYHFSNLNSFQNILNFCFNLDLATVSLYFTISENDKQSLKTTHGTLL